MIKFIIIGSLVIFIISIIGGFKDTYNQMVVLDENVSDNAPLNLYAQNRVTTTLDRVLQRISK